MCLQAQELSKQLEFAEELKTEISRLVDAAHVPGPYFLGAQLSLVDVQFAPWMLRLSRVLKPYRGWPDPEPGSRWGVWMDAIERDEVVKATTSTDELYLDSYERYAGEFLQISFFSYCLIIFFPRLFFFFFQTPSIFS
jgi:hypothetical protein